MVDEATANSSPRKHISLHASFGSISTTVWLIGEASEDKQSRKKLPELALKSEVGSVNLKLVSIPLHRGTS